MDLAPYLQDLRSELTKATALADDGTRDTALRLADSLDAALRLSYLHLLTDAAAELTAALHDRVVEVRMDGAAPVLTLTAAPERSASPADNTSDNTPDDTEGTARITLRLPESIKARADEAADATGVSLNSWIVAACRAALAPSHAPRTTTARRFSGWA